MKTSKWEYDLARNENDDEEEKEKEQEKKKKKMKKKKGEKREKSSKCLRSGISTIHNIQATSKQNYQVNSWS